MEYLFPRRGGPGASCSIGSCKQLTALSPTKLEEVAVEGLSQEVVDAAGAWLILVGVVDKA